MRQPRFVIASVSVLFAVAASSIAVRAQTATSYDDLAKIEAAASAPA
ncbi:hypothetical protein [Bradyrhizobium sp. CER78]|nr:hypothetical protein [Bradyrhizobium sp. CER78]MDH2382853.1 hypothetical protein [Bradyrhizobium sp. CER78]